MVVGMVLTDHDFEPFALRAYVPICFPDLIAEAVRQYVGHGHPMGGYLTALFAGDVFRSVCNADAGNFAGFALQCKWIAQCCPTGAFGSYENVEKWIEAGGLAGLEPDWKPQREEG